MNDIQIRQHSRAVFNDEDRSAIRLAACKPLVYLDSCIWIDIAERLEPLSQRCRSLVRAGEVLFPVSFPAVQEVLEQPTAQRRSRVAALMDELSKGICFRPSDTVHQLEAKLALPVISGATQIGFKREEILTWIVEFAAKMELQFSPRWNQADAGKFTRLIAARPELRSVKWIVDHSPPGQMCLENAQRMERFVQGMKDAMAKSISHHQHLAKDVRWKQLLLEERIAVVKNRISPQMTENLLNALGPEKLLAAIAAISKQVGEGGEHRLAQVMKAMPSLDIQCHLMAERVSNHSRKPRKQDFFDVEHAIVGGAYADIFVTSDGNLFDLLTRRCRVSSDRGCRVVRGANGLEEALTQIASQNPVGTQTTLG
jgi:hypothetical protein